MRQWRTRLSGFLLIEHVVALGVFIVGMLLFIGLFRWLLVMRDHLATSEVVEWHLCLTQLDDVIAGADVVKGSEGQLLKEVPLVPKKQDIRLKIFLHENDRSAFAVSVNGGNESLLLGFTDFHLSQQKGAPYLQATLLHGTTFQARMLPSKRKITLKRKDESPHEEKLHPPTTKRGLTNALPHRDDDFQPAHLGNVPTTIRKSRTSPTTRR